MNNYKFLHELRVETTNVCDMECPFCPREQMNRVVGTMSLDLFKHIVSDGVACGIHRLSLCGFGEAALDYSITEKIRWAKDEFPFLQIVCGFHAKYLSDDKIAGLGLDAYRFSFSEKNMDVKYQISPGYKNVPCKEIVLTLVEKKQIDSFFEYWKQCGFEVSIWNAHNHGYGRKYRTPSLDNDTCGRPFRDTIEVMSNGKVRACNFDFDGQIILGDCNKNTITEIYFGEEFSRFRRAHASGKFEEFPVCHGCDQRDVQYNGLIKSTRPNAKTGHSNSTGKKFI